jgi:hypothetical protein
MVQILRLRRPGLRRKLPVASVLGLFLTIFAIGLSVGTTSGAPIFSSPVTAAQSRLYYDANIRIRKDGLAFLVGVKAEWLGLTVLNNGNSYTDSVYIANNDVNPDKYPWLAFSPLDGTGYVAWNYKGDAGYETYVRIIPPAYDGVGNKTLGAAIRLKDKTGYQIAQPSIGVDSNGIIYVTGYVVNNPVQLTLFRFDSGFNLIDSQVLDQQPGGARSEMDTQMCIDSNNNVHITTFFPYGTASDSPSHLFAYSRVNSPSFVKTDITPSGWTLKKGRQGKDIACAADGTVYVAVNNNRTYDLFKRDAGAGGSEKWHQVQSNLFNTTLNTSVGVGTSLDGRVWATQGDGLGIIGTNVKYSTDGGITFSANEQAMPTSAYQNMSVAVDGNGPGGKVHLIGSFYFTSGDFSQTTLYATANSITNLPAPANLVATPVSQTEIDLSWTAPAPGADQYQISRSPTGADGSFTPLTTVAGNITTFANTGLSGNTAYYYQVTATKSGYNASGPSNTASATTFGPVGIVFGAQPANGVAGTAISPSPTIRVVDQSGTTYGGYNGTVTFSIAPGTGNPAATLGGTVTQNISNGVSSFGGAPLTISSVSNNYQLKAVAGSFSALSNSFNQTGSLSVAVLSSPITATVPFTVQVTVKTNNGASTDTSYNGVVFAAFTTVGGVYPYGPTSAIAVNGVANFVNEMIDTSGSNYTYGGTLPDSLGSGTSSNFSVVAYTEAGSVGDCTRILLSSAISTCNSSTLPDAFTNAGSKPVYVDHKALGPSVYNLPSQVVTIPAGSWLDAGCSGPSNSPWGMLVNVDSTNTFTVNGGNTYLRGIHLFGTRNGSSLLPVPNNKTGNSYSCTKVEVGVGV